MDGSSVGIPRSYGGGECTFGLRWSCGVLRFVFGGCWQCAVSVGDDSCDPECCTPDSGAHSASHVWLVDWGLSRRELDADRGIDERGNCRTFA